MFFSRNLCGLRLARRWSDLRDVMKPAVLSRLKAAYSTVDDIDLFAGGILESAARDSLLGPTFRCLVADQFRRLRSGAPHHCFSIAAT